MKSELLNNRKMSLRVLHFRELFIAIQYASLGALQLSLGNTLPPRELIASWTFVVNSGNSGAYREKGEII